MITASREFIHKHPSAAVGVTALLVLVAAAWIVHQKHDGSQVVSDKAFFTSDDGATLFADRQDRIPPFQHDGKEAVRAYVFTCDDGKHRWVQYLQKYTDDSKKVLELSQAGTPPPPGHPAPMDGLQVKKPGLGAWLFMRDVKSREIIEPKCPDGEGSGPPIAVEPPG